MPNDIDRAPSTCLATILRMRGLNQAGTRARVGWVALVGLQARLDESLQVDSLMSLQMDS